MFIEYILWEHTEHFTVSKEEEYVLVYKVFLTNLRR